MVERLSRLGFIDAHATDAPRVPRQHSRGVPPALEGREVFCTHDPAVASHLVGSLLGKCKLTVDFAGDTGFQAALNAIRVRGLTLAYLDFHSAVTLDIPVTDDIFAVHIHTFGQSSCLLGHSAVTATSTRALVTSPGEHARMVFDFDSPQLIVRLERATVEAQLSRMLGRSIGKPIVFEPILELTAPNAVRWNLAMQLLSAEVIMPDSLLHQGIGLASLEELLVSSLLLLQPSNYSAALRSGVDHHGTVKEAADFIERHLAEPLTLARISSAVHLGPRSVQQAFRDDLDTTPTAYVRDRRLDRVRADLVDAFACDGASVTAIAERWGFTHLGSFSVIYRKRFSESPSQTLRDG